MANISYLSQTSSTTGASTYTFSGRSLGAAQEDRQIIVGVSGRASGTGKNIVSVTVGGVNATKLAGYINNASSTTESSIWIADVPTGTTGDVVVTHNSAYVRVGIALWRVTGGVEKVGYSGFSTSGTVAGPPLVTVNGGVAVGMAVGNGTGSVAWTGLTESFDAVYGSTNTTTHSGAIFSTSGSTVTPRANIGGSTTVLATTVVVLVPKDSVTDRFLAASGNWNDPGVWSLRFGSPVGAPAPVANNSVFMGSNFTVTLTDDAECTEVFHNNGTLSLGSSKLTTRLGLTSGGDIPRTINLGSGVLSITEPVVSSDGIVLWGSNLTLLPGSSLVELNIPYDDEAVSFDVQSRTFNDVRINMGQGTNNSTALNINGSPTFNSLIIQSKNSATHTVNLDNNAVVSVNKLVAIGPSGIEELRIENQSGLNYASFNVPNDGSIYMQNVFMSGVANTNGANVPGYIGASSGFLGDGLNWLRQDPPKISTLVDPLTTAAASNGNWSFYDSGEIEVLSEGSGGGGYRTTDFYNTMTTTDTYDLIDSSLVLERTASSIAINDLAASTLVISNTPPPGFAQTSFYPFGQGGNVDSYDTTIEPNFIRLSNNGGNQLVYESSEDAQSWTLVDTIELSDEDKYMLRSVRLVVGMGDQLPYDEKILSVNVTPASLSGGNFLAFFTP